MRWAARRSQSWSWPVSAISDSRDDIPRVATVNIHSVWRFAAADFDGTAMLIPFVQRMASKKVFGGVIFGRDDSRVTPLD